MSNKIAPAITDCDPSCETRRTFERFVRAREDRRVHVPRGPYEGNPGDIRPTDEGHRQLAEIHTDYVGLEVITSIGENCVAACAIEAYLTRDQLDPNSFGSEMQGTIVEIRQANPGH